MIQRVMGSDAHTASLFPGEPLIDDRQKIALAVYVEKLSPVACHLVPWCAVGNPEYREQPTTWLLDQAAAKLLAD